MWMLFGMHAGFDPFSMHAVGGCPDACQRDMWLRWCRAWMGRLRGGGMMTCCLMRQHEFGQNGVIMFVAPTAAAPCALLSIAYIYRWHF